MTTLVVLNATLVKVPFELDRWRGDCRPRLSRWVCRRLTRRIPLSGCSMDTSSPQHSRYRSPCRGSSATPGLSKRTTV